MLPQQAAVNGQKPDWDEQSLGVEWAAVPTEVPAGGKAAAGGNCRPGTRVSGTQSRGSGAEHLHPWRGKG